MTQDAKVGFGDTPVRSTSSTHPIDRRRPESNELQTSEHPSSLSSNVRIVPPKSHEVSNPWLQGVAEALDQATVGTAGAVRQLLTDQVTPLRLAGHVAVLLIAAVVLLLSQISLPDWQLRFEPTPGAQLVSGFASMAAAEPGFEFCRTELSGCDLAGGAPGSRSARNPLLHGEVRRHCFGDC
jgi:hypothetical protein